MSSRIRLRKKESIDLSLILIWPVIAVIISLILRINFFSSIILFFIIPSVYLSFKGKEYVKKVFLFSIATGIVAVIAIDYMAHISGNWFISSTIFPRIFGIAVVEGVILAVSVCYFVLIFYEYFIT